MIKVKCPKCGYESDISNKKCLRCNHNLIEALRCKYDCKNCKNKCSIS